MIRLRVVKAAARHDQNMLCKKQIPGEFPVIGNVELFLLRASGTYKTRRCF
jgi:hypothetical protein